MKSCVQSLAWWLCLSVCLLYPSTTGSAQSPARPAGKQPSLSGPIVLVAGEVTKKDKLGHHDYLGGCKCLETLLRQTAGTEVRLVPDAWPETDELLDQARAVLFYCDGGGKQPFLASPDRIAQMERLSQSATGLIFVHQAVDFPAEHAERAKLWLGGIYVPGKSGRGHWPSSHVDFPDHPTTRGVMPWKVKDGWLNELVFVDDMQGITPLVWSGKKYQGSRSGLNADIVGWAYQRPSGGRTFCFTGLDAHDAWSLDGMRQLMVNGILWSAGAEIPEGGAACAIDQEQLAALQTPREAK